jgi:uncharacterized protein YegL
MAPDNFDSRLHPLYFVLDVSRSMWKAWRRGNPQAKGGTSPESFMSFIPNTLMALTESPMMRAAAWVSVLGFSDRPQVLQPIRPLTEPPVIAEPTRGVQSDYEAVLRFLLLRVHHDSRVMTAGAHAEARVTLANPWVLFITDGAPFAGTTYQAPARWLAARDRLVSGPPHARIATIGLAGSCLPVLWRLATGDDDGGRNAFLSHSTPDPDGLADSLATGLSISRPGTVLPGSVLLPTPDGMRRIRRPDSPRASSAGHAGPNTASQRPSGRPVSGDQTAASSPKDSAT